MTTVAAIVDLLAHASASPSLFNHYAQAIPGVDLPNAPQIRRENLTKYLSAHLELETKELWVLEAPSKRGALRTGVPLTSESKLSELSERLRIVPHLKKATDDSGDFSRVSQTSQIVWGAIGSGRLPLLWNAIMLRPHHQADLMDTRNPTTSELANHAPILSALISMFQPEAVIWVGRKAERIASFAGVAGTTVRHPANGGKTQFLNGIAAARNACLSNC